MCAMRPSSSSRNDVACDTAASGGPECIRRRPWPTWRPWATMHSTSTGLSPSPGSDRSTSATATRRSRRLAYVVARVRCGSSRPCNASSDSSRCRSRVRFSASGLNAWPSAGRTSFQTSSCRPFWARAARSRASAFSALHRWWAPCSSALSSRACSSRARACSSSSARAACSDSARA